MKLEHMTPSVPGLSAEQVRKAIEWLDRDDNRATFCERNMIDPTDSPSWVVWFFAVDRIILRSISMGAMDIDDWHYRDDFEDGVSPGGSARAAISNAMGGW